MSPQEVPPSDNMKTDYALHNVLSSVEFPAKSAALDDLEFQCDERGLNLSLVAFTVPCLSRHHIATCLCFSNLKSPNAISFPHTKGA